MKEYISQSFMLYRKTLIHLFNDINLHHDFSSPIKFIKSNYIDE